MGDWSMSTTLSMVEAVDAVVIAGQHPRVVEVARQRLVQDVVDQRALAAAADAGDAVNVPSGNARRRRAGCARGRRDDDGAVRQRRRPPLLRRLDLAVAAQVRGGERPLALQHLVQRALRDDLTAVAAGARAQVDDVVRGMMVSRSCSTTSTVLPRSRSCISVWSSRSLSRWCRPMLGSSRM
jgi:hypothetical protein